MTTLEICMGSRASPAVAPGLRVTEAVLLDAANTNHRRVVLCEIDPLLVGLWKYLIRVNPKEILAIPDVPLDGSVDDLKLIPEASWLVGFWLNRGTARPRKHPSRWMREKIRPGSFWGPRVRETIASQVEQIRHWEVVEGGYKKCRITRKSTWFVDPPYQEAGCHYKYGPEHVDYDHLADWCKSRQGQVIVCENTGADWLPFRDLTTTKTTRTGRRSSEAVWMPRLPRLERETKLDLRWADEDDAAGLE